MTLNIWDNVAPSATETCGKPIDDYDPSPEKIVAWALEETAP
ncbi:hypothetical protein [Herbaspirillum chlorophenolicum]|nr:hypothetical protein [Herbaspirillum chlorophenolicum]